MKLPDDVKAAIQDVRVSELVDMMDRDAVINRVGIGTHEGAWLATSLPDQWMDILRAAIDVGDAPDWKPVDDPGDDDSEDEDDEDSLAVDLAIERSMVGVFVGTVETEGGEITNANEVVNEELEDVSKSYEADGITHYPDGITVTPAKRAPGRPKKNLT